MWVDWPDICTRQSVIYLMSGFHNITCIIIDVFTMEFDAFFGK